MVIFHMSPAVTEWFPAIVALAFGGFLYGLALHTKRVHDRAKGKR